MCSSERCSQTCARQARFMSAGQRISDGKKACSSSLPLLAPPQDVRGLNTNSTTSLSTAPQAWGRQSHCAHSAAVVHLDWEQGGATPTAHTRPWPNWPMGSPGSPLPFEASQPPLITRAEDLPHTRLYSTILQSVARDKWRWLPLLSATCHRRASTPLAPVRT